eukprot:364494-Chlamydomonas_euryale.AAC.6
MASAKASHVLKFLRQAQPGFAEGAQPNTCLLARTLGELPVASIGRPLCHCRPRGRAESAAIAIALWCSCVCFPPRRGLRRAARAKGKTPAFVAVPSHARKRMRQTTTRPFHVAPHAHACLAACLSSLVRSVWRGQLDPPQRGWLEWALARGARASFQHRGGAAAACRHASHVDAAAEVREVQDLGRVDGRGPIPIRVARTQRPRTHETAWHACNHAAAGKQDIASHACLQ